MKNDVEHKCVGVEKRKMGNGKGRTKKIEK
jgi:hypothetical protein